MENTIRQGDRSVLTQGSSVGEGRASRVIGERPTSYEFVADFRSDADVQALAFGAGMEAPKMLAYKYDRIVIYIEATLSWMSRVGTEYQHNKTVHGPEVLEWVPPRLESIATAASALADTKRSSKMEFALCLLAQEAAECLLAVWHASRNTSYSETVSIEELAALVKGLSGETEEQP